MNNIYLIGMPGCGKTTIGRQVSSELNMEFTDLDEYIVKAEKRSIEEMFGEGEAVFRKAETRCLLEIAQKNGHIVSTGGGIVVTEENIEIMKKSGTVIFIDSEPDTILKNSSLEGRPLLKDKSRIYRLYGERADLYRSAADYTVENNGSLCGACAGVEDTIRRLLSKCKQHN